MTKPLNISTMRRNRANLRAKGLSTCEIQVLEEIALQMRGSCLRKLRGAYLAKCLGLSSQWVNELLRRLDRLGLIVRFKTGLIRLNLEKLSDFSAKAAKKIRRKPRKWLKMQINSARRRCGLHNKEDTYKSEPTGAQQKAFSSSDWIDLARKWEREQK